MAEKYYYSYEECVKDTKVLVKKCKEFEPDILLAIARGGLTLGHLISEAMNTRNLYTLNSIHYEGEIKLDTFNIFNIPDVSHAKRVLLIDDIVDSGETMDEIFKLLRDKFPGVEFKLATIFYKKTAILQPDFCVKEAKEWIDFFWEADLKE